MYLRAALVVWSGLRCGVLEERMLLFVWPGVICGLSNFQFFGGGLFRWGPATKRRIICLCQVELVAIEGRKGLVYQKRHFKTSMWQDTSVCS